MKKFDLRLAKSPFQSKKIFNNEPRKHRHNLTAWQVLLRDILADSDGKKFDDYLKAKKSPIHLSKIHRQLMFGFHYTTHDEIMKDIQMTFDHWDLLYLQHSADYK